MIDPRKLLRELVSIPSVNPAFLAGTPEFTGEARVGEFLASLARKAGLDVEWQPVFETRSNLIVRMTPPGKPRHTIVLAPHLDTVGAETVTRSLFKPVVRGGRLHGRGACDTKGSAAAMFSALLKRAARKQRGNTEIIFAGLVDEENAQTGSRVLGRSGLKGDLAIVGEPTQLKVVTAHRGDVWLRLVTKGKAAHGATPHLGRNAVLAMAKAVQALEGEYARQLRDRRYPLLGPATINVGAIRGGVQANVVPDHCEILADRRTLPGETEATVQKEIAAFFRKQKLDVQIVNYKNEPCDPLETDPGLPLVRLFMKQNSQRKALGVHFFCDAAVLAGHGIPSIVFGPGNIAQAHTADEWIELKQLDRAERLLLNFFDALDGAC